MRATELERFWRHVEKGSTCWLWVGAKYNNGYGHFYRRRVNGKQIHSPAHRAAYELLVGPIPDGMTIDHLCRNIACVNPAHLEPVTPQENVLRGDTIPARKAAQTHCIHGHEFTPENTYRRPNGCRSCRTCKARWKVRVPPLAAL